MKQPFTITLLVATFIGLVLSDITTAPGIDPSDTCDKCCQGYPGHNGINGQNGLPGRDGLRGSPGDKGERGEAGTPGPASLAGLPGPRGPVGERGEVGPRGFPGKIGPDGMRGLPGTDGRDGAPGIEGLKGQKGDVRVASARSAFMVLRSTNQLASNQQTLDFTYIQTNIGSNFDINTDRFTCQIPGVYVFNYHIRNRNAHFIEIMLMMNGVTVTEASSGDQDGNVAGSAVLVLQEGDEIWLQFDDTDEAITCNGRKGCGFNGYLLYEN